MKYRAFIACCPSDRAWGHSLHRALERVRIPWGLIGRETPLGRVPKLLRPIYIDADAVEPADGAALADKTLAALGAAQFLIVVCSPQAGQSRYLDAVVTRFKQRGHADRIIPVIVGGAPGAPADEVYPPALRVRLDDSGAITPERQEPIAPVIIDARPASGGKHRAKLRLTAALVGLDFDQVVTVVERARRGRTALRAAAVVLAAVVLTLGAATVWASYELPRNPRLFERVLQHGMGALDGVLGALDRWRAPRAVSLDIVDQAATVLLGWARLGSDTGEVRLREAWMLTQFAGRYDRLGAADRQRAYAAEARRLIEQARVPPDDADPKVLRDVADIYSRSGDALRAEGALDSALARYRQSLAIRARLAAADPAMRRSLSVSQIEIGDALALRGSLDEALDSYRAALDLRRALAAPGGAASRRDLSVSHERVGDALRRQDALDAALDSYRASLAIRLDLSKAAHPGWERDLAIAYDKVGDVLMAKNELGQASEAYRAGLAVRLAASEPDAMQRDLSVSYERIGDAALAEGAREDALTNYRAALAIRERLAAADPAGLRAQWDLVVINWRLAKNGDDTIRRFDLVLRVLRRLAAAGKLAPDQQRWLTAAEREAADLRAR